MLKVIYIVAVVTAALACGLVFDSIPMMFFGAAFIELGSLAFRLIRRSEVTSNPMPDIIPTYLHTDKPVAYMWYNPETGEGAYADIGLSATAAIDEDGEALPPVPGDDPTKYQGRPLFKGTIG